MMRRDQHNPVREVRKARTLNLSRVVHDLRNVRCVRYAHNGHDGVAELRGRAAFRALAAYAWLGRRLGGHGRVCVGDVVVTPPCRDEVLFIVMPGSREVAWHVEWRRRQPNTPVVVDVTGDVLGLTDESEWSEAGRAAGRSNTATSREWWARPEPRDALTH